MEVHSNNLPPLKNFLLKALFKICSFVYQLKIVNMISKRLNLPVKKIKNRYFHNYLNFNLPALHKQTSLKTQFRIENLHTYCKYNEISTFKTVNINNTINIQYPHLITHHQIKLFAGYVRCPSPYCAELYSVCVIGGTSLILNEHNILNDEISYNDYYGRYALKASRDIINLQYNDNKYEKLAKITHKKLHQKPTLFLEHAIHFLYDYSINYYHFLFEVIPRILILKHLKIPIADIPILIDINIQDQSIEAAKCYFEEKVHFIKIERFQKVYVKKLIFPSFLSICHDLSFDQKPDFSRDFIISPLAINFLKNKRMPQFIYRKPFKKIFINRTNSNHGRDLINIEEIKKYVTDLGFEIISPEKHSFAEQQQIFADAHTIICCGGAAMANIVFCAEKTNILMLTYDYVHINPYIFSTVAQTLDVNLKILCGKSENPYSLTTDYTIDIEKFQCQLLHFSNASFHH